MVRSERAAAIASVLRRVESSPDSINSSKAPASSTLTVSSAMPSDGISGAGTVAVSTRAIFDNASITAWCAANTSPSCLRSASGSTAARFGFPRSGRPGLKGG